MRSWRYLLGIKCGCAAVGHDQYDRHASEHDRLEDWHGSVHDRLEDEHAYAHEEGLSRRKHRQLHRELDYQHDRAAYRIGRQHRQELPRCVALALL